MRFRYHQMTRVQEIGSGSSIVFYLESWVNPRLVTQRIFGVTRVLTIWEALEKRAVIENGGVSVSPPMVVGNQRTEQEAAELLTKRRLEYIDREPGWRILN